jgi:hypothetical protein
MLQHARPGVNPLRVTCMWPFYHEYINDIINTAMTFYIASKARVWGVCHQAWLDIASKARVWGICPYHQAWLDIASKARVWGMCPIIKRD